MSCIHILLCKTVARGGMLCYTRGRYKVCGSTHALGEAPHSPPLVGEWGQEHRKGGRVRTSFDFRSHCRALCHGCF